MLRAFMQWLEKLRGHEVSGHAGKPVTTGTIEITHAGETRRFDIVDGNLDIVDWAWTNAEHSTGSLKPPSDLSHL